MAIDGIYMKDNTITTSSAISGKDSSQLDMGDFLNLLVAQMSNQDMLGSSSSGGGDSSTDYISQLATFSALQGIQTMQEYQLSSYAASYAGKYVTIANQTVTGDLETVNGKVEAVSFYDGSPKVQVNGKTYDLFKIMEVSDTASTGTLAEVSQYIGKTITVSWKNEYGESRETTGKVTGVTITNNVPQVIIGGKEYSISSIKTVDTDTDTDTDTETDTDEDSE